MLVFFPGNELKTVLAFYILKLVLSTIVPESPRISLRKVHCIEINAILVILEILLFGIRTIGAKIAFQSTEGARDLGLSLSCSNFLKKLLQFSKKVAQKLLQNSKSCSKVAPKSKSFSKVAFYFWV